MLNTILAKRVNHIVAKGGQSCLAKRVKVAWLFHSLHSDCKNVQKPVLKSVNVQRTGKSILQMFAFSFFDGSHICRFLPILRPPTVPRSHFRYLKTKAFVLIISHLYLQIVTSASGSRFCVGK